MAKKQKSTTAPADNGMKNVKPGVILDYDAGGNMVSFEILDASKRKVNPMSVEYAVTMPVRPPA